MFRKPIIALAAAAVLASAALAQPPDLQPDRDMTEMRQMMDRAGKTSDPGERRELMRKHMEKMHERMQSMHGMMGEPESRDVREEIREMRKRLDLMQLMLEQMLLQQRAIMEDRVPEEDDR
ncbi:MAG: hypothetical protein ACLFV8_07495 [Alphaproteobacteria bacterium]